MLEEVCKLLIEDVFADAFRGLFRRAQTPRVRRLKTAAWLSLGTSAGCFLVAAWPAGLLRIGHEAALVAGLLAALATLAFGWWASFEQTYPAR